MTVFFETWGADMTAVDNYMKLNIENYQQFCDSAQWAFQFGVFEVFVQVDVNECLLGLFGTETNNTDDCSWNTSYINLPIYKYDFSDIKYGGVFFQGCEEPIPDYEDQTVI